MGNYDLEGSRSIPSSSQSNLSKDKVENRGLEVKHFLPTRYNVAAVPVVQDKRVYVGDANFPVPNPNTPPLDGYMYAFDTKTGDLIWEVQTGGVIASPLIDGNHIYVGTITGQFFAINRITGAIEKTYVPNLRPGFDQFWSGPILVKNLLIIAVNPGDEFPGNLAPGGLGALIALNPRTFQEVWRFVPVDNDTDEPPIAGQSYGGAGIWNTAITYSSSLGLLFVGTGQNTYSTDGRSPGSDSVFAINIRDGSLEWQTQTQNGDIWNFNDPFYYNDATIPPRDMDIGDAPAFFMDGGEPYVAVGSKRGYFYVMEARTGKVVNGVGTDSLGFLKGYEVLTLPGPSTDGGYNLDGGYYKEKGEIVHFGIVNDYGGNFDGSQPFCFIAGIGIGLPECPIPAFGHLVLMNTKGSMELGRYSNPNALIFSPIHLDGMIFVRETVDFTIFDTDKLLVIDVTNTANPQLMETVDLPSSRSFGAHLSVSGGLIFSGNGFTGNVLGSPSGLWVIGLK